MEKEIISKYRSDVIEKSINIEFIINMIISQHYFKKVVNNFIFELLYDVCCNYRLKRNVLKKIIPEIDKTKLNDMDRLNSIRNYFAHCNQEYFKQTEKPTPNSVGVILNPHNLEKYIDFQLLYEEFINKEKDVVQYLLEILKNKGGEFEKL